MQNDDNVLKTLDLLDECVVHESCRKWYNNQKRIDRVKRCANETKSTVETRSTSDSFFWNSHCFLCGCLILEKGEEWHRVEKGNLKESLLGNCKARLGLNTS